MVYSGTDISGGFEYLSNADIFLGRTRGRQEYGLWRYAIFLMVCGVLTSKSRTYKRIKYQPPSRFKLLVRSRPARERMDSLSAKLGRKCNVSQIYARTEMIPLFKTFLSIDEIEMILDRSSEEKEDEKEDLSSMNKGKKRQRTLFDF
jgi:replication factor C large subunit